MKTLRVVRAWRRGLLSSRWRELRGSKPVGKAACENEKLEVRHSRLQGLPAQTFSHHRQG